jgi:acetylornithine deacetylase/succinyl-diaminopimelate desuccinylase-like protein
VILISDTGMISNQQPSITTGLRGLSYVEVEVTGPNRDYIPDCTVAPCNPINVLKMIVRFMMRTTTYHSRFYDNVEELSTEERAEMAKAPLALENYKKHSTKRYLRRKGVTNERNSIRPTLDVNGIWGGYTGEGQNCHCEQSIAKISMRLVPNQDWEHITELFTKHFTSIALQA